jgi:hypothetical protein
MKRLESARLDSDLRMLLVPDHGHRRVTATAHLGRLLARSHLPVPVNPRSYRGEGGLALTSGDSSAYVYLSDETILRREEIANRLSQFREIELACWREGNKLHFVSRLGRSSACVLGPDVVRYTATSTDPLGLLRPGETEDILDMCQPVIGRGPYPDVIHQYMRSHVAGRSGDMLLFAGPGYHFGKSPRIAWRFGYHRGSHGGPFEDEVMVSAVHRGFGDVPDEPVRAACLLRRLSLIRDQVIVK